MNSFATAPPTINQLNQADIIYDAKYFLGTAREATLARHFPALTHVDFSTIVSKLTFDLHSALSVETISHIAETVGLTIDQFQVTTRELSSSVRDANIILFECQPDAPLDSKAFQAATTTTLVTRRLALMESFLKDLITNDFSPLRLLNIMPETSFDPADRKVVRELLSECSDVIRGAITYFVPATERAYSELLNMIQTIRTTGSIETKTTPDSVALARAHVGIGSALTTLETGLFSLKTAFLKP